MSVYMDEREMKRVRIPGTIQFSRSPGGQFWDAELLNSTEQGLCFQSDFPYLPETFLVIRSKNPGEADSQFAKVVWSRPEKANCGRNCRYHIGVTFTH
ncbi:MAG: PilZ domain-containing protein [Desulfobacterales bacterium]|nr:PilZ domain-containing protein [Desulfobacterales bacterium]